MRLTCPKCGATYALGAETVPQGGSHVQCGVCHTRWFVRAERPAAAPSEDQIVARLEGRAARPAAPSGEAPAPEPSRSAPVAFPGPSRSIPVAAPAGSAPPSSPDHAAAEPAAAAAPGAAVTPLRPRPTTERTAPGPSLSPALPASAAAPARGGRRAIGFIAAMALAGLGLAAYLRADAASAQAPMAAPALAAYVSAVDAGRSWIEARLGPLRDRLLGD